MSSFNSQEMPLVSICIPAYNAEATIAETLDTVLAQDYPLLDVVVSDNQSTDNAKAIVQEYANRGVRYVYHSEGRPDWAAGMPSYIGAYLNANYALSHGQGDFLCLYHADDVYQPDIIRKQVEVMQSNPNVGAVFTMLRTICDNGQPIRIGSRRLPPELRGQQCFDYETLFNAILTHSNFLPASSVMLRRSALEAVGGFNEQQWRTSADLEMWLRIAQRYAISIIDEPLLNYRVSQIHFSAQYNKLRTTVWDFFIVIDHFLDIPEVRQRVRPEALFRYEMQRTSDDIIRAANMIVLGEIPNARSLLKSACSRLAFKAGLRDLVFARRFWLGNLLRLSLWLGLGNLGGKVYKNVYQPWLMKQRLQPLTRYEDFGRVGHL